MNVYFKYSKRLLQMFVATRYATQIRSSSNVLRFCSRGRSLFLTIGEEMEIGHFYYIDDQYFKDFPDPYLMQNKEKVNGQLHDRPCFYAFQDSNT